MSFYRELVDIEGELVSRGFTVHIPVSAQIMKDTNDFDPTHIKDVLTSKQKQEYIVRNFDKIAESDSILVVNGEKHGIKGYIGANVLMEIGLAFYFKKNIYIWNPTEKDSAYNDELRAFEAVFVNQDIEKIV